MGHLVPLDPTGDGYFTIDITGKVVTYGDAVTGPPVHPTNDIIAMALTPTGNGYWILTTDGDVHPFGDAVHYGDATVAGTMPTGSPILAESIESHPITNGYWVLPPTAPFRRSTCRTGVTPTARVRHHRVHVRAFRRTHDGGGYWIVSGSGIVQAKGNAPDLGDAEPYPEEQWVSGIIWAMFTNDHNGYALQHADGTSTPLSSKT